MFLTQIVNITIIVVGIFEYLWFLSVPFKAQNLQEKRKKGKKEKIQSQISIYLRLYFDFSLEFVSWLDNNNT